MKFQYESIVIENLARILIDLCSETDGPILRTVFAGFLET